MLVSAKIKHHLTISEVLSFLGLGKIRASLDCARSVLNLMARRKNQMANKHDSWENNFGFLKDWFCWERSIEYGQIGNYRLYGVLLLKPLAIYKVGDKIAKMDISLISGKIDIHREDKNLMTFDIKTTLVSSCSTCSNTGQIGIGYDEPEWDNCPDCNPRRGV